MSWSFGGDLGVRERSGVGARSLVDLDRDDVNSLKSRRHL